MFPISSGNLFRIKSVAMWSGGGDRRQPEVSGFGAATYGVTPLGHRTFHWVREPIQKPQIIEREVSAD